MKKFLTLALVGAMLLGVSSVVYANFCAFDQVPAATLLFPFVHFDYNMGAAGSVTNFAITNVSSEAQIVHVTLWTDYTVAILDFNILLTGYDVQTMNIRDILMNGNLPITGGSHSNVGGTPNSDGPVSGTNSLNGAWIDDPGIALAAPESTSGLTCTVGNPADYTGGIPASTLLLFQTWLQKSQTVNRYYDDSCAGGTDSAVTGTWWLTRDYTTATWMYITADVVTECNKLFPDNINYFSVLSNDNVLMGDMTFLDPTNNFSEAMHAVHIEADMDIASVVTPTALGAWPGTPISFYHRYAAGNHVTAPAPDFREPLPTAWAFRYFNEPLLESYTKVRAWKGSTLNAHIPDLFASPWSENVSSLIANNCLAYTYYAWDEEENVTSTTDNPWSQPGGERIVPNLLPLETQEVPVGDFTLPDAFGWMLFVWPASNFPPTAGVPTPDYYQTWMGVKYHAFGQYSAAMSAAVMANYNCFSDQVLPNLGINYDYVGIDGYNVPVVPVN
ncbi:MAG: hypothetical protein DRJ61_07935 [Acidobacteria bacterium]|nr:MAG: hypothetical protein DRJ65_13450 [Acidobacteriota bacterium]RLE33123.1 MAG: hypothetical protein DRJ61_07935 [Acidobacteriota bacterium]